MKKIITILSVFFLLSGTEGYSQTASTKGTDSGKTQKQQMSIKWTTNPFDNQVFIENKGQFDGVIPGAQKVYYVVRMGDIQAFFTANGIIYQLKKYPQADLSKGQDPDVGGEAKPVIEYVNAEWKGVNANTKREGDGKQSFYYTYPSGISGTIKTAVFKKITYRNLYPGIDVEYSFKEGKQGIEYKLVAHPGADISLVKLLYSKGVSTSRINADGDIEAKTNMGTFKMSSPKGFYADDNSPIHVSYLLNGNEESFSVTNPDVRKTYIIDPWVTNPLFTSDDRAYDLDYDNHGNVYVYGGDANPYQLVKLNNLGAIQWVFNATTLTSSTRYYGDFAVDKVTAESYLVEGWNAGGGGARAEKVNTNGILVATFGGNPEFGEMYRVEYDACNRDVVVGGGGTSQPYQACVLDTNMVSINPVNVESVGTGYHDMALIAIDPSGNTCYMGTTQSLIYTTIENNYLLKLPLPALTPAILNLYDGLSFHEINSVFYTAGTDNGFNGMAASPNWLYLYSGDTLRQLNKTTGALNRLRPLNRRLYNYHWGGLDVDACDDIYIGYRDSIKVFNSTLQPEDSLALGAATDTVFDLRLGQHGALYACGIGFVSQIVNPITPNLISSAAGTPSSCSACNGTATVNINCGISPFSFHWSNGNTNQTDTGLCAGVYTVTVTDASCPPNIDSVVVTVNGEAGFSATVIDTNPDCAARKGSAYAKVVGGHPPYTYAWSNGCTTQKDTGLVAGTYSCTITDNIGCKTFVSVVLRNPTAPHVTVAPALDSICAGGNISLLASGAKTYSWTPSAGLTCNNCANPTASPTVTTTYTITGSDSLGCTDVVTATIKIKPGPHPIITGPDSTCNGTTVTLNVTGGLTYEWFPSGSTTTSISFVASSTQTITVLAANGSCSHDTTFVLTVVPDPTAFITWSRDSVCSGDSTTLEGATGLRYKWEPGNLTTAEIHVRPLTTTIYTLYTYSSSCIDSAKQRISIIPAITGSISTNVDSICPGGSAILSAKGTGGQATYKWSPGGATTSSITVTPPVTMTYTAEVCGLCDTLQEHITITVVPVPAPVINGTNWKCKGVRDTLTVINTNGPATYVWSNGKTTSSYTTGFIEADSIVTVTAYNKLGCRHDTTFTITLRTPNKVGVSAPKIFCAGQQVCIWATYTGSPSPSSFLWSPDGQTTDTICVSPTDTTSYNVTVSNGCKASKSTELTPNYPNLNACCNQTLTVLNDTLTPGEAIMVASGNSRSYSWSPAVTCLNPPLCDSVQVSPKITTTYTVTGVDSNGCSTTAPVTINVEVPCFNPIIPNVFTPSNGGMLGLDKVFYIKTDNIAAWSITIFDRWGKTMYNSTDQYKYWDGTTGSGGQAPAGVYYYIITGTCQNTTYKKDGYLQLIR